MPLQDKFTSENPYVLTVLRQTATSNQVALRAALDETLGIKATAVIFQSQGLNATTGNAPPPQSVASAAIVTLNEGGFDDDGLPCFVGHTPITMFDGSIIPIIDVRIGSWVTSFDETGQLANGLVIGKWEHLVWEYLEVEFADGRITDTISAHRYWKGGTSYARIGSDEMTKVLNLQDQKWVEVPIKTKTLIQLENPISVFNLTVLHYHNYIANSDGVSNVKRNPDEV